MRISVFTGKKIDADREAAVRQAIDIAKEHKANLLLLPGNAPCVVGPNDGVLQELATRTGVSILAEVKGTTSLFRPNKPRHQFYAQQFAFSAPRIADPNKHVTPCKARKLIELLNDGNRVFKLAGKRIAVLLCGESNILRNDQAKKHPPCPRYGDIQWPFKVYDVLVNPTHTSWQRWFLLRERMAYCSQKKRMAIFCANNRFRTWENSLFVYHNGKECLRGDLRNKCGWPIRVDSNDTWRMVTVEV